MQNEPVIAPSAYKHEVDTDDILHAFNNPMFVHTKDEGFTMVAGPGTDATMIEVGYIVSSDNTPVIVHAMSPARNRYLR